MGVPGIEPDTSWHGSYVETPSRLVRIVHGAHENQIRVGCTESESRSTYCVSA